MKNILVFSMLALLSMSQAVAQDYEYVPFVREGVKWEYHHYHDSMYGEIPGLPNEDVKATLELKGDTVINGKTYKAMHKYHGDAINMENDTVVIYLREEDKIVYGIVPNGIVYVDCPIGHSMNQDIDNRISSGEEFILYNFKDPQHYYEDALGAATTYGYSAYLYTDTLTIGGGKRACHMFYHFFARPVAIIEGIGSTSPFNGYTLHYMDGLGLMSDPVFNTSAVRENDENFLPAELNYSNYRYYSGYDDLYFGLGNLKWVNERVTVIHGDTTRQYYTYQFKSAYDKDYYSNCYYQDAGSTGTSGDSVIADLSYRELFYPRFINNKAFAAVSAQNRNMIDFTVDKGGGQYLYFFKIDNFIDVSRYYMARQREPFLNQENFVEIEPLYIDGNECSRWAYLGEDGEPLAYVVEGIGFDSRDLGDLLTPFTRKPDPDADYQEWCGLCHVVKDGKVIYKGMRYTPDNMTGIDEVVADKGQRAYDGTYYNLMGQPVGKEVPTTPGIYIHNGNKILVR